MSQLIYSIAIITLILLTAGILLAVIASKKPPTHWTSIDFDEIQKRAAGQNGEQIAIAIIRSILHEGDCLLTNVSISYDGKRAELDNVIINPFGVFIIEVKDYKGRLYGNEDDYTWEKYKDDGYGNTFEKEVKNPIKQVKRQVYILARTLNGFNVWVEGYAFLVQGNSPVQSNYILENAKDIDRAIHSPGQNHLSLQEVEQIRNTLVQR